MKFGINLLLLGDSVTPAILRWFPKLREMGFDGVEVPAFNPGAVKVDEIRKMAERTGLSLIATGSPPPGAHFYGTKAEPRRKAEKYLHDLLRIADGLDARLVCGPLYKPVGDQDESLPFAKQRQETAKAFRPIARQAEELQLDIAFEMLNRFETNFLNTVAQGIEFCKMIDSPNVGLQLDTFHMHIEEKDTAAAVRAAAQAGLIYHFHASENDRGIAGTGQVAWKPIAEAVRRAKYSRWIVLESFNQTNQAIRTAVSCWRPFYPSAEEFLRQGLRFVRKTFLR